ncbi:helix-turn-helix domain-containing protein [bacterium 210820-DFI.6.37]|nr:helix-turn-helix domain-containing protein [bacterium 210820-DFI.6.37]
MYEDFFSKRLIELRLEKGISARDMSLSLGQSDSYINRIENKKMLPSLTVFFYICEFFDITPQEFFDGNEGSTLQMMQLVNDLKALEPDQLKHIAAIVKDMKR